MATIYDLKPHFQELLRPTAHALAGWGVTANQLTAAALALLLGLGVPAGTWTSLVLGVMVVLALLTIGNRARRAMAP